jgi:hypothetical protein
MIQTVGELKRALNNFDDQISVRVVDYCGDSQIISVYKGNSNYHRINKIEEILIRIN